MADASVQRRGRHNFVEMFDSETCPFGFGLHHAKPLASCYFSDE